LTGNPTRVPPHDLDAEAAVLSAILLSPERLYEAQAYVAEQDFYSDANRRIFRAIETLEREGSKPDTVTVAAWLRAREQLQQIGGVPYLSQVTDATPAIANMAEHARIIGGLGHRRRLIAFLQVAVADGFTTTADSIEWGQSVEAKLYEQVHQARRGDEDGSLAVVMPRVVDGVMARYRGESEPVGIPTGFRDLDIGINGLKRAKSYIVGGRPGMGKTAFMSQICTNVARQGMLVVEICTEQKREEIALRKLAQATALSFTVLESNDVKSRLSRAELDMLVTEAVALKTLPLALEYLTSPTIGEIRSTIRRALARLRRTFGDLPVGLISLDQLQHFDGEAERGENREVVVSRMSREIAGMAGAFDCPLLLACQLNREVEKRPDKRPVLSDLRESGSLEQDAFGVFFPFRGDYYKKLDRGQRDDSSVEDAELIIAKHKNGPAPSIALSFDPPSMAFESGDDARLRRYAQEEMAYGGT
jgi:replicative DNA helicase